MSDPAAVLRFEPEDLDGHTIDELTDYLEAGCSPPDPSIDDSPACRIALAALRRLRDLAGEYLEDGSEADDVGDDWVDAVLAAIPIEAKAGRRFPIAVEDDRVAAHVTEGALRGLVRSIGDDVPGLLVGSVRFDSVPTGADEPAALEIDVALVHGTVLPDAVARFRAALLRGLPDHAPFAIGPIDIHVVGLILPSSDEPDRGAR